MGKLHVVANFKIDTGALNITLRMSLTPSYDGYILNCY